MSEDKWRDAVKFLMGQGVNPTLTKSDQRRLGEMLRGPFANGVSAEQASVFLQKIGWVKDEPKLDPLP
jgi:hypothetical protein